MIWNHYIIASKIIPTLADTIGTMLAQNISIDNFFRKTKQEVLLIALLAVWDWRTRTHSARRDLAKTFKALTLHTDTQHIHKGNCYLTLNDLGAQHHYKTMITILFFSTSPWVLLSPPIDSPPLSEKTRKSNRFQILEQRQHHLSYFKTL